MPTDEEIMEAGLAFVRDHFENEGYILEDYIDEESKSEYYIKMEGWGKIPDGPEFIARKDKWQRYYVLVRSTEEDNFNRLRLDAEQVQARKKKGDMFLLCLVSKSPHNCCLYGIISGNQLKKRIIDMEEPQYYDLTALPEKYNL